MTLHEKGAAAQAGTRIVDRSGYQNGFVFAVPSLDVLSYLGVV